MKILVTGSTGLVGTALVSALTSEGHTVSRLMRPQSKKTVESRDGLDVTWNPETAVFLGVPVTGFEADAVVNLAGASIADGRWTEERKKLLRFSRIYTTRALVNALRKMNPRPKVFVSASAIGIYGNRGEEMLTEESRAGTDFLSGLAREWEAEALKAEALGMRVVLARFGIILAREGGALPKMMLPFKFGAGGKLGSGKQWMSWIAIQDVVGILKLALENSSVGGALNIVAPGAVQNTEFTKVLAKAMHRPALFPAPGFALRLALGEMADALLLSSQRVVPQKLQHLGYSFEYSELPDALTTIVAGV